MSNLLAVPLKQTYQVNIKDPVRAYLQSHATAHPDEFKDDILEWQSLRKNLLGEVIHNDRIRAALALVFAFRQVFDSVNLCLKLPCT